MFAPPENALAAMAKAFLDPNKEQSTHEIEAMKDVTGVFVATKFSGRGRYGSSSCSLHWWGV